VSVRRTNLLDLARENRSPPRRLIMFVRIGRSDHLAHAGAERCPRGPVAAGSGRGVCGRGYRASLFVRTLKDQSPGSDLGGAARLLLCLWSGPGRRFRDRKWSSQMCGTVLGFRRIPVPRRGRITWTGRKMATAWISARSSISCRHLLGPRARRRRCRW